MAEPDFKPTLTPIPYFLPSERKWETALATSCSISEQVAQPDRHLLKNCQSLGFKGIKVIAKFLKIRKEREITYNISELI